MPPAIIQILQQVRHRELFQPAPSIGLLPFDVSQKETESPAIIRNLQWVQHYELFLPTPSIGLPPFDVSRKDVDSRSPRDHADLD
jgi:hypothetical protein